MSKHRDEELPSIDPAVLANVTGGAGDSSMSSMMPMMMMMMMGRGGGAAAAPPPPPPPAAPVLPKILVNGVEQKPTTAGPTMNFETTV